MLMSSMVGHIKEQKGQESLKSEKTVSGSNFMLVDEQKTGHTSQSTA